MNLQKDYLSIDKVTSGYPELNTALHWTVQKQRKAIVKILLNVIVNQDVQHYHQITNLKGVTAAQLASTLDNKDIIALFQQSSQNIGTKEYWYEIGEKFYNEKQYIEAIENFDKALSKALALDPYSAYALQGKGLVAYQKENFKQAEEYFQKAEAHISPDKSLFEWSELFCRQGKVFMSLKAWDKAQEAFNKALTFDPKNFPAQKALEELNQVSKSTPDNKKN